MEIRKNELVNAIENIHTLFINKINDVINVNMPGWTVTSLNHDKLIIGFNNGDYWNDGTPKRTNVDFYIGTNVNYDRNTHTWVETDRFEINPFTAGGVSVLEDSYLKTYYSGIGFILNNIEFSTAIKKLIDEFLAEYNSFNKELSEILREEQRIEDEKKRIEEEAKRIEHFNKIKAELENNPKYVVICPDTNGKFIYRRKNVHVVCTCSDYTEAYKVSYKYNNAYYDNKYKIIEATKIKLVA